MTLPCLIPVRRLPTPSRSRHFGGLSEKKTLSDHVTRNAIVARSQQWGLWTRQGQTVVLYSLTLSLETLDTRILLLAVFTLALEMDYPSSTACVQSPPPLQTPFSDFFLRGGGSCKHATSETDNPSTNCPSQLTDKQTDKVRWIVHSNSKPLRFYSKEVLPIWRELSNG